METSGVSVNEHVSHELAKPTPGERHDDPRGEWRYAGADAKKGTVDGADEPRQVCVAHQGGEFIGGQNIVGVPRDPIDVLHGEVHAGWFINQGVQAPDFAPLGTGFDRRCGLEPFSNESDGVIDKRRRVDGVVGRCHDHLSSVEEAGGRGLVRLRHK